MCSNCKKNYRVIPDEFQFYKQLDIPLPRLCPDCRHVRRVIARGPNKLWNRTCMCGGKASGNYKNTAEHFHKDESCPNKFQTPFAPEREEMLYCADCYNAEVA